MRAAGQLNGYLFGRDDDPRAGIEEATEDLARLGVLVAVQGLGEHPVDRATDDGEEHVEVDV